MPWHVPASRQSPPWPPSSWCGCDDAGRGLARHDDHQREDPPTSTTAIRTHTFLVRRSHEDEVWLVEHADRDEVFTYGEHLTDARRHAVDVIALADDVDESEVGPVRSLVEGPVDRP